MDEIRAKMSSIDDPRNQSYVKYAVADILIIIMCAVLCGLDTFSHAHSSKGSGYVYYMGRK